MNRRDIAAWAAVFAIGGWLACAPAQAQQAYRCAGPGGQVQWSDRPCSLQGKLGGYGAAADTPSRAAYGRYSMPGEPPPYYEYLGAECRSLSDAMRTAHSRGVGPDVQRDLQRDWQRKCTEEAAEASRSHQEAQRQRNDKARDEKLRAQAEARQAQVRREQCDEMLRILATKRKRTDLSDGERTDLRRFEENYHGRCG